MKDIRERPATPGINRRDILARLGLILGLGGGVALAAGAGGLTFRLHTTPRRIPFLTPDHLEELTQMPPARPRLLFVGNSMTHMHDLPARVAAAAARDGVALQIGVAAANGARLIETWRLPAFRHMLSQGWDVLVPQDFSTTCLRVPDRWGSAYAIRSMARQAQAGAVVLYPTWAFPIQHRVYRERSSILSATPSTPEDFADRIIAHYASLAHIEGWVRAPVTEAMQPDPTPYLADDKHHLNPDGAALVADILWQSLRDLPQLSEGQASKP